MQVLETHWHLNTDSACLMSRGEYLSVKTASSPGGMVPFSGSNVNGDTSPPSLIKLPASLSQDLLQCDASYFVSSSLSVLIA